VVDAAGAANVLVLAPSVKSSMPVHRVVNKLQCLVSVNQNELRGDGASKAVEAHKLRVCTFNAAKGLEAPVVIVFMFDEYLKRMWQAPEPCDKNALYVALTRSCGGRLHVIQHWESMPLSRVQPLVHAHRQKQQQAAGPQQQQQQAAAEQDQYQMLVYNELELTFLEDASVLQQPLEPDVGSSQDVFLVTDITRHVDAISLSELMLGVSFESEDTCVDSIDICTEVEFESEAGLRYTEDVSALYGLAIPLSVEFQLKGRCVHVDGVLNPSVYEEVRLGPHETLQAAEARLGVRVFRRAQYDDIFPSSRRQEVLQAYAHPHKTAAHWLFLANACIAFDRYFFLLKQVTHYAWADAAGFERGAARLRRFVGDQPVQFERALVHEQPGLTLVGAADAVQQQASGAVVLEFKFSSGELSDEHVLQAALYASMLGVRAVLYNVRTGQLVRVSVADPQDLIVKAVGMKRLSGRPPLSDAEFLQGTFL
jgi:hypothetical protein